MVNEWHGLLDIRSLLEKRSIEEVFKAVFPDFKKKVKK